MANWFDDNNFLPDQNPQLAPASPWDPQAATAQLTGEYGSALGRTGDQVRPDEIQQYLPAVQQYGWEAVKNQIDNSPEAQAYRASRNPAAAPSVPFAPQQPLSLPQMAAPTPYALPTQAEVEQTPGYQFTRDQGIQGVMRSDIARGTGLGGAALKDIAQYTTGLADQYYGNRVNQGMATNNLNFGQGLQTNQFNTGNALSQFGSNLGAQNQFWNQGFNENRNAFDQYRGLQNDTFDQWYKLAQLGNPGNPYS